MVSTKTNVGDRVLQSLLETEKRLELIKQEAEDNLFTAIATLKECKIQINRINENRSVTPSISDL